MRRFVYSLLIVVIISGVIITGIVQATDPDFYDYGTFDDFPNMDGNWERCADGDGPLEVDTSRKVYIDIDAGEDVYSCSADFYSYANNPNYKGQYCLSTSINVDGAKPDFSPYLSYNGPWWVYKTNEFRKPQTGDIPQDIGLTSASSWANGSFPLEPINPDSNSQSSMDQDLQLKVDIDDASAQVPN